MNTEVLVKQQLTMEVKVINRRTVELRWAGAGGKPESERLQSGDTLTLDLTTKLSKT